jgi:hypothetical protein
MKETTLKVWMFVRWPLLGIAAIYLGLVVYRIPAVMEKQQTQDAVAHIHAQKITLEDVMGKNLPPAPDKAANDATVAGIDANHNGIRDDVELAIFKNYPTSPKIRAAQLQYALALQVEMTEVFNSGTWIAAAEEDERGYECIGETYPRTNLSEALAVLEKRAKEIQTLVFNTDARKEAYDKASAFTTSYGIKDSNYCQVELSKL